MRNVIRALMRLARAKWNECTRYDLKGDLQMETSAAWQDLRDAFYGY